MPVAALLPAPADVKVDILVDGRALERLVLTDRQWHTVRIDNPTASRSTGGYWRIDMHIEPIGARSSVPDADRLIAVGEIAREQTSGAGG